MAYKLLWVLLWIAFANALLSPLHAEPIAARQYRNTLIRMAHTEWGLNAPIAVFAGQLEQESGWNPDVCSPFACGLAQFTGPTAKDISKRYASLAGANVFDPAWALRAVVIYDRDLYRAVFAADDCDRWAFTLSSYNGGLGNLRREISLCDMKNTCQPTLWWNNVAEFSVRNSANFAENRGYVTSILLRRQATYSTWGAQIQCLRR